MTDALPTPRSLPHGWVFPPHDVFADNAVQPGGVTEVALKVQLSNPGAVTRFVAACA